VDVENHERRGEENESRVMMRKKGIERLEEVI
jgi:hypothetical protein